MNCMTSLKKSRTDPSKQDPFVEAGKGFFCTAVVDYPAETPTYLWSVDESDDCKLYRLGPQTVSGGQSVKVTVVEHPRLDRCTVRLAVYDSTGLVGDPHKEEVFIEPPTGSPSAGTAPSQPYQLAGPPANAPLARGKSPKPPTVTRRVRAAHFDGEPTWPDRVFSADGYDPMGRNRGSVKGLVSLGAQQFKVAVYTLTNGWWLWQQTVDADPNGEWQVVAQLGSGYAAQLVTGSFVAPERKIRALPSGKDVLDTRKTP
jgi:hypothetical protein